MRLFVGIAMPEAACEVLEDLQAELRVGRFADPETFHLTLAFLGEVEGEAQRELHEALERVEAPGFALRLTGLGTFGSKAPRVLWAGAAASPELLALHRAVGRAARRAGLDLARERFRPHVTLARFAPRMGAEDLERVRRYLETYAAAPLPEVAVGEITLYRSHLRPGGSVHEVLEVYPLGTG